jgi:hypothetical protein
MTSRPGPVPAPRGDAVLSSRSPADPDRPIHQAALAAGVGLLVMAVLAGFGNFVAVEGLVTPGDAARTTQDIAASEGLFRLGVTSLLLVIALDVLVAWGLYRFFAPVNEGLALLAAWARLAYAVVFLVAITHLLGALRLVGDPAGALPAEQRDARVLAEVEAFSDVWAAGLLLFGLHLLAVAWLVYRSGYVPRWLGVLLAVAGAGYAVDSLSMVLSAGSWPTISAFTFLGELLLAFWLVLRGRQVTLAAPAGVPGSRPARRTPARSA